MLASPALSCAEVGAVGGALSSAAPRVPLALGSNKSCYGHTEGAAGELPSLLCSQACSLADYLPAAPGVHSMNAQPFVCILGTLPAPCVQG